LIWSYNLYHSPSVKYRINKLVTGSNINQLIAMTSKERGHTHHERSELDAQ
jgi:hypothetical protein